MFKKIRHILEALGGGLILLLLRFILPPKLSSSFMGWVARTAGPLYPRSDHARSSIKQCFPSLTDTEVDTILREMWDNYGRLISEYINPEPFWDGKKLHNIEVVGAEHLTAFWQSSKPGLIFTAHTGNWQMILLAARSMGYDLTQFYKATSNPWSDMLMQYVQKLTVKDVLTKQEGPRALLSLFKSKGRAMILVDQKTGDGILVPFLGRNALTASGWARLALSQGYPLLPARSERLSANSFRVTFYSPLPIPQSKDKHKNLYDFLVSVNAMIGEWVKERPGQWFWLHRRWKGA